jgi:prepilin-type processing-associated H-X9-DG protein
MIDSGRRRSPRHVHFLSLVSSRIKSVQKVREAAARVQCQNNLKQIGIGMHNYHGAWKRFPPGFTSQAATIDGPSLGPGWGWAAHLLPYLELQNVHRQIDFAKDIADPANAQARVMSLPIFRCPSDAPFGSTFTVTDDTGAPICDVAFGNYVGMAGVYEVTGYPDTSNGAPGVLLRNSRVRVIDITDGSSNTLFVGERASKRSPQTTWVGAVTGASVPPQNPGYDYEGPGILVLTNSGTVADGRVPNNPLDHVEDTNSMHMQGVNFLFGDGSVRIMQNTISPAVWVGIATRAGDEPVNIDF